MALLLRFRLLFVLCFNIFSTRRGCMYLLYVVKSLFVASRGVAINESPRRLAA